MPLRSDWSEATCPIARSLDVVGDPWVLLVLREALTGATRFDDFRVALGVADNVLSRRLSAMVEGGLLVRSPYVDEHRTRHEYLLTDAGRDLLPVVQATRRRLGSTGIGMSLRGLPISDCNSYAPQASRGRSGGGCNGVARVWTGATVGVSGAGGGAGALGSGLAQEARTSKAKTAARFFMPVSPRRHRPIASSTTPGARRS